jgi:hypothetical protein
VSWSWHRWNEAKGWQYAETETLAPPKGRGWTVVPGQGPGIAEVPGIGSLTPARNSVGSKSRRPSEDKARA